MFQPPFKITILKPIDYFRRQLKETQKPFEWIGYPKILRAGYCNRINREIVLCKGYADSKTLYHELGHELGLEHSEMKFNIMYPWRNRGTIGADEIDANYAAKYGYYHWAKMKNAIKELEK